MIPASARARLGRIVVLLALCLALTGCGKSKITQENFDKIKNDMTLKEVEAILGEGTSQGGDGANVAAQVGVDVTGGLGGPQGPSTVPYLWEHGKKSITVNFRGGKVVGKEKAGF
jgi:hypothetical protein